MRAPQPEPPIPGSFATPSLLAWIVNGKYVMSLPLYRIETDLKACGATISRQDMANWMMNVHVCVQLVVAGLVTMIFRV
ncbi:IS66 family transposase [Bifidobacterium longum]|uniref:IS66 family transposase n=1 Tax=Bifidobacterium longum TaxID=216816 RepID=UPI003D2C2A28